MKIAIADNNSRKFTDDIIKHWENAGHEVRYESGASEFLAQWADVYYVDTWDNNIHYLFNLYHGVQEITPGCAWDNNKKPRIIVRALDLEVWIGLARDQRIIDWVDDVVVIAPHIEEELRKYGDFKDKIHLIRPGVNLEKFTVKSTVTDGFQLGMVLGDMWWPKNHMGGLDIFTTLYQQDNRWRLHIRGQHEGGNEYWKRMFEHYLQSRDIEHVVTLYEKVEDINQWYEQIDVLLHPGMKEAFCYAVGEAMAKDIQVVVNTFLGSDAIWSRFNRYYTHDEAIRMIKSIHKVSGGRNYIRENYSLERMLSEYDNLIKKYE